MAKNSSDNKQTKLETGRIRIIGKTLVFDNSIYQIPNISSVEVGMIIKPVPWLFWVLLVIGVLLTVPILIFHDLLGDSPWGFVALGLAGLVYVIYWANRKVHGLLIRLNSGLATLIVSDELSFLKDVATVIRNVMDGNEPKSLTLNLDKRTIIDNVSGSALVLGDSIGDVINRVSG